VADSEDSPPVPPSDPGGDERIGWWISGTLCIVFGWGVAVAENLLLHWTATTTGFTVGPWWIGPTMGPFAWTVFGIGLAVGGFGVVLLHLASKSLPGPFRLPGYPY
jgi:hypothetical protein